MRYILYLLLGFLVSGCGDNEKTEAHQSSKEANPLVVNTGNQGKHPQKRDPSKNPSQPLDHKSPTYVQSKVERGGTLHFVMDSSKVKDRGIVGMPNGVNLCFIVSGLQLLLHANPFRDFLHDLSNRSPQITAVTPILEDLVHMFNKVWGDGWPDPPPPKGLYPKIRIHHRLYESIVKKTRFQVNHGAQGDASPFLERLLQVLKTELDIIAPGAMSDLFVSQVVRTAPHISSTSVRLFHVPQQTIQQMILEITPPDGVGYVNIETMITDGFLGGHRYVEDFDQCNVCGGEIVKEQITGRWTKFPRILTFSVFESPIGAIPDPAPLFTFLAGIPLSRDDPRVDDVSLPNRVQYELVGYSVYVVGHYIAIVKNFETGEWFKINDSSVLSIDNPDPRPVMINPEYRIANIMYVRK